MRGWTCSSVTMKARLVERGEELSPGFGDVSHNESETFGGFYV